MSHIFEDAICVSVTFSLDRAKYQNFALHMEKSRINPNFNSTVKTHFCDILRISKTGGTKKQYIKINTQTPCFQRFL